MLLDNLEQGCAGSGAPKGEDDAEGDKNVCSEMIVLFSHLSANDRTVFLQAVCSSQSSPIGLSAGTVPQSSVPLVTAPFPRLSQCLGDQGKSDVSFQQWRCELLELSRDTGYSVSQLSQAIRRSLQDTATDILLQLGSTISVANVIAKFDGVFGDVLPAKMLMEQFYSARQKDGETAAIWACRL
jgi:hypothetical protein